MTAEQSNQLQYIYDIIKAGEFSIEKYVTGGAASSNSYSHTFASKGKYLCIISCAGFNYSPSISHSHTCKSCTELFNNNYQTNRTANRTKILVIDNENGNGVLNITTTITDTYKIDQIVILKYTY